MLIKVHLIFKIGWLLLLLLLLLLSSLLLLLLLSLLSHTALIEVQLCSIRPSTNDTRLESFHINDFQSTFFGLGKI